MTLIDRLKDPAFDRITSNSSAKIAAHQPFERGLILEKTGVSGYTTPALARNRPGM